MRGCWSKALWVAATLAVAPAIAACGGSNPPPAIDAGPAPDAPPVEPDAAPPAAAREMREVVGAGGRVTGGSLTMDVQVGHPIAQDKVSGGTLTVEGAAVVKP
jgi:hypothetical protein